MIVVYCDNPGCGQLIKAKDHVKIDVMKQRRDAHRGACYDALNAHKMAMDKIAQSQIWNAQHVITQADEAFWKGGNSIGIPEEAPR